MPQLFETAHSEQIKQWLTTELGPICDAEPDVLSDYVIALLKHDASETELAAMLNEQLADFLDDKTETFVSKLVATLSTKSYLPPDQRPSSSRAPTGPSSSRKRGAEEEGRRSPPKNPRSSDQGIPTGPRSAVRSNGGVSSESDTSRDRDVRERRTAPSASVPSQPSSSSAGSNGPQPDSQPTATNNRIPKGLCRDFHQKGWCSRGENCRYEHSTDAITGGMQQGQQVASPGPGFQPQQQQGQQQQQGMSGMPMPNAPFNGMRGGPGFMGRPPMGMNGFPMNPAMFGSPPQGWPMAAPPHGNGSPAPEGGASLAARFGEQQRPQQPFVPPPQEYTNFASAGPSEGGHGHRGGMAGGRGGSRGGRGGGAPAGHFQSQVRSQTTLVIENVPADSLDFIKINDYFKRFGTITNIQIDQPTMKALVSYSSPAEAKAAHESPEVIFGNRFVKVYFQRLDEPLEGGSTKPSAPVRPPPAPKQTFAAGQNVYRAPGIAAPTPSTTAGDSSATGSPAPSSSQATAPTPEQVAERKKALESRKQAQDQVNILLTEQKQLLLKLGSAGKATAEEKKAGMSRLRELEPEIKEATETVRKAVATLSSLPALPASSSMNASAPAFDPSKTREKMEKERLDRELEFLNKGASATPGAGGEGNPAPATSTNENGSATPSTSSQTEELKAKLASLKAEAAALGINNQSSFDSSSRGRGGSFAARGRGSYRGGARGGSTAAPMRLDNRPTTLLVSDIPSDASKETIQTWLKSFGEVSSFSTTEEGKSEFTATFKTRQSAEAAQRTAKIGEVPNVGKITLTWSSAPVTATGDKVASTTSVGASADGEEKVGEGEGGDEDNWKR